MIATGGASAGRYNVSAEPSTSPEYVIKVLNDSAPSLGSSAWLTSPKYVSVIARR